MSENLLIGLGTMMLCLAVQCLGVSAMLHSLRSLWQRGRIGTGIVSFSAVLTVSMIIMMLGNLLQMAAWAGVFIRCGEFSTFTEAFYHSAVNFSSLGYGDIVMSEEHRLLGALEAGNGILMFGLTTSILFWVVQTYMQRKVQALKEDTK